MNLDEGGASVDRWSSNPFLTTAPKMAKTTQGVRSVDYRAVSSDKTAELTEKLRGILAAQGLACTDKGKLVTCVGRSDGLCTEHYCSSRIQHDQILRC